jgi:hypothetical protein
VAKHFFGSDRIDTPDARGVRRERENRVRDTEDRTSTAVNQFEDANGGLSPGFSRGRSMLRPYGAREGRRVLQLRGD